MTYRQTYDKLFVTSLTPEQHERTCRYWYTVTNGAVAHTAFETRAGLDRWLSERGLRLENDLPEAGTLAAEGVEGSTRIIGEYHTEMHGEFLTVDPRDIMGPGYFYSLSPVLATSAMSNGQYTLALITEEGGVRTVHTLNPNVRDRVIFDHNRTRELMR